MNHDPNYKPFIFILTSQPNPEPQSPPLSPPNVPQPHTSSPPHHNLTFIPPQLQPSTPFFPITASHHLPE
jgi:hypothetical protein